MVMDGLEDTQEAGGAHGHSPGHSLNIENKFASKIIEEISQPEACHHLGDSFRKNDQGVGHGQVLEG